MSISNWKKFLILKLIFVFVFSFSAFGADYYVNVLSGSNENSGSNATYAWKTITYALSKVEGNESDPALIYISSGTYCPG